MLTLYHETTHAPITMDRIRGDRLAVRRYIKPDRVGSVWLPETARTDRTQSLWEILAVSEGAAAALGWTPPHGAILQTTRRFDAADLHAVDDDGHAVFLLSVGCKACPDHPRGSPLCSVRGIVVYDDEEAADAPHG